eukprot:TRINITY_DN6228_c0_g2_i1.p1 TRINITY_DN6228_c0_g2~~TRINITY_DN6228_c0_g2_i1.p1  ORF type:complete len:1140 (+),score=524.46 TRINITY_DN6228_c0_g2_i1:139-3558(+)
MPSSNPAAAAAAQPRSERLWRLLPSELAAPRRYTVPHLADFVLVWVTLEPGVRYTILSVPEHQALFELTRWFLQRYPLEEADGGREAIRQDEEDAFGMIVHALRGVRLADVAERARQALAGKIEEAARRSAAATSPEIDLLPLVESAAKELADPSGMCGGVDGLQPYLAATPNPPIPPSAAAAAAAVRPQSSPTAAGSAKAQGAPAERCDVLVGAKAISFGPRGPPAAAAAGLAEVYSAAGAAPEEGGAAAAPTPREVKGIDARGGYYLAMFFWAALHLSVQKLATLAAGKDGCRSAKQITLDITRLDAFGSAVLAAQQEKARGNDRVKVRAYEEAIRFYTQAIDISPPGDANRIQLYTNRALAWSRYHAAAVDDPGADGAAAAVGPAAAKKILQFTICDCDRALQLDPASEKAWYRRGKALESLGELATAVQAFASALYFHPANEEAKGNVKRILRLPEFAAEVRALATAWGLEQAALRKLLYPSAAAAPSHGGKKEKPKKGKHKKQPPPPHGDAAAAVPPAKKAALGKLLQVDLLEAVEKGMEVWGFLSTAGHRIKEVAERDARLKEEKEKAEEKKREGKAKKEKEKAARREEEQRQQDRLREKREKEAREAAEREHLRVETERLRKEAEREERRKQLEQKELREAELKRQREDEKRKKESDRVLKLQKAAEEREKRKEEERVKRKKEAEQEERDRKKRVAEQEAAAERRRAKELEERKAKAREEARAAAAAAAAAKRPTPTVRVVPAAAKPQPVEQPPPAKKPVVRMEKTAKHGTLPLPPPAGAKTEKAAAAVPAAKDTGAAVASAKPPPAAAGQGGAAAMGDGLNPLATAFSPRQEAAAKAAAAAAANPAAAARSLGREPGEAAKATAAAPAPKRGRRERDAAAAVGAARFDPHSPFAQLPPGMPFPPPFPPASHYPPYGFPPTAPPPGAVYPPGLPLPHPAALPPYGLLPPPGLVHPGALPAGLEAPPGKREKDGTDPMGIGLPTFPPAAPSARSEAEASSSHPLHSSHFSDTSSDRRCNSPDFTGGEAAAPPPPAGAAEPPQATSPATFDIAKLVETVLAQDRPEKPVSEAPLPPFFAPAPAGGGGAAAGGERGEDMRWLFSDLATTLTKDAEDIDFEDFLDFRDLKPELRDG